MIIGVRWDSGGATLRFLCRGESGGGITLLKLLRRGVEIGGLGVRRERDLGSESKCLACGVDRAVVYEKIY